MSIITFAMPTSPRSRSREVWVDYSCGHRGPIKVTVGGRAAQIDEWANRTAKEQVCRECFIAQQVERGPAFFAKVEKRGDLGEPTQFALICYSQSYDIKDLLKNRGWKFTEVGTLHDPCSMNKGWEILGSDVEIAAELDFVEGNSWAIDVGTMRGLGPVLWPRIEKYCDPSLSGREEKFLAATREIREKLAAELAARPRKNVEQLEEIKTTKDKLRHLEKQQDDLRAELFKLLDENRDSEKRKAIGRKYRPAMDELERKWVEIRDLIVSLEA